MMLGGWDVWKCGSESKFAVCEMSNDIKSAGAVADPGGFHWFQLIPPFARRVHYSR